MELYSSAVRLRNMLKRSKTLVSIVTAVRKRRRKRAWESLRECGLTIAGDITRELTAMGATCFVTSGTLLGIVREGKLLDHDDDLDLCVVVDGNYSWKRAFDEVVALGFTPKLIYTLDSKITEITFDNGAVSFDLFGGYPLVDENGDITKMRVYSCARLSDIIYRHPEETTSSYRDFPYVSFTVPTTVDGVEVMLPNNPFEMLETNYGSTWETPDASWDSKTGLIVIRNAEAKRVVVRNHSKEEIDTLLKQQG